MNNYPKEHEELLRKAGLIGYGIVEVRAIHHTKQKQVSDDGSTWESRNVPDEARISKSSTSLIYDKSGRIDGYWANGLTMEEKMTIHQDCGVPLFYLGEPDNPLTGMPTVKDTRITIVEGDMFNLSNPSDMAKFLVLVPIVSMIGANKKEAMDNDTFFYFYSVEEEKLDNVKKIGTKKDAVKLIDEYSSERKQQVVQILVFEGILSVDYNISRDAAVMVFDEAAFDVPASVLQASNVDYPKEHICIYSLISSGHIEAADYKDGPFYKNPDFYGQRTHLADTLAELKKKIESYPDLVRAYRELSAVVSGDKAELFEQRTDKNVLELFNRHKNRNEPEAVDHVAERKKKVQMLKKDAVLALLDSEDIEHQFTEADELKTIKEFYINLKAEA